MTDARAQIEITASTARLPATLRTAVKMVEGFAISAGRALLGIKGDRGDEKKGVGAWGQHAMGQVVGGLATRGIDLMVKQATDVMDFERELVRFGIDLRKMPGDMQDIGKGIREISNQTGLGAMEVLKAGRAYADLAGAEAFTMEKMSLISRAATASGADVKDMAELLFTLTENMKVPPGELENTIGGLINQAKDGSIHFKELSHELVALGPVYAQFGITGREGAIQLGAMMQVARRGFGSASEAGTGVLRILRSIPQHASKFRKFGIEVFQPGSKTNLDQFLNIINKIRDPKNKLSLDREALIKAFGRTEGERFYQLLVQSNEQFMKLIDAGRENGTVLKDMTTMVTSAPGRFDVAIEHLKNKVAAAFTPERIDNFVTAIEDAAHSIEPLVKAVGFIGDVLGGIYNTGKKIRGAFTPDDSRITAFSPEQIEAEAKQKGISPYEAMMRLQGRHGRWLGAKQAISAAMVDDRTTPASDKLAVAAAFDARDVHGEGASSAGTAYIEAAGLTPERVAAILKQVVAERVDADIAKGKGRTAGQADMVAAFNSAIKETLAPAVSRAIVDAVNTRPSVLQVDGNSIATAAGNATNARRR
jgi:TP901 family phage tail tape measure protein